MKWSPEAVWTSNDLSQIPSLGHLANFLSVLHDVDKRTVCLPLQLNRGKYVKILFLLWYLQEITISAYVDLFLNYK